MLIFATEEEKQSVKSELLQHKQSGGELRVQVFPEDLGLPVFSGYEATTLLHIAAKYGNTKAAQHLLDNGYQVDVTNPSGSTPLMLAMQHSEDKMVKILVVARADIFLCNRLGMCAAKLGFQTPINFAHAIFPAVTSICRDSRAIAEKLLELGCPLPSSTMLNDASVLRHMLDNGRAVDEPDPNDSNRTALHYAVLWAEKDIVNSLLDWGIDANVPDDDGKTPLFCYDVTTEDTDEKIEVLKIMLRRGASLTATMIDCPVLLVDYMCGAARNGTVRTLMEYNDGLLAAGKDGFPLLRYLIANENDEIIDIFQSANWDFNSLEQPITMLSTAVYGNPKVFEYMIRKGADLDAAIGEHTLLIMLSTRELHERRREPEAKYLKCVELVLYRGADAQRVFGESMTVLDGVRAFQNFALGKIVLAHLALIEELGSSIKELIMTNINSDVTFQKYFDLCKRRLEKMKRTVIYRRITLFKFLTESEMQMVRYARNEDLMAKLKSFMYRKRNSTMYYDNVLRRRLTYGGQMVKLKDSAIEVLLEIRELQNNKLVAHIIVEYLDYFDLLRFA